VLAAAFAAVADAQTPWPVAGPGGLPALSLRSPGNARPGGRKSGAPVPGRVGGRASTAIAVECSVHPGTSSCTSKTAGELYQAGRPTTPVPAAPISSRCPARCSVAAVAMLPFCALEVMTGQPPTATIAVRRPEHKDRLIPRSEVFRSAGRRS
jgi:hypothetical protein